MDLGRQKFLRKSGEAQEQTAQGSAGVTSIPGGVEEAGRCGTEERGLLDVVVLSWTRSPLVFFSSLNYPLLSFGPHHSVQLSEFCVDCL